MTQRDLSDTQRYAVFRHHAWAGAILLSILFALRILIPDIPDIVVLVVGGFLVVYILVALFFTYKYRAGLIAQEEQVVVQPDKSLEREKLQVELEEKRLKLEKKKVKAESKATKKAGKKE